MHKYTMSSERARFQTYIRNIARSWREKYADRSKPAGAPVFLYPSPACSVPLSSSCPSCSSCRRLPPRLSSDSPACNSTWSSASTRARRRKRPPRPPERPRRPVRSVRRAGSAARASGRSRRRSPVWRSRRSGGSSASRPSWAGST